MPKAFFFITHTVPMFKGFLPSISVSQVDLILLFSKLSIAVQNSMTSDHCSLFITIAVIYYLKVTTLIFKKLNTTRHNCL